MRARVAVGLVVVAATVLVVVATGARSGSGGSYKVRAIFDNATFIIAGEDVKIAGAKVGKVDSLDVTPEKKAAITLDITEPGFDDFRKDAHCTIRPESLIGERFVECAPTVPRKPGEPKAPPLQRIPDGKPGAGSYLLPVTQTSTPVDVDLIADATRLPYRQRLSLIINELGTGLAANGDELHRVIRRANPALGELDKVLAILAAQNRTLADIARDSDTILQPLARDRRQVADFVDQASQVAQATAERRGDLEANIERLPTFLAELRPTARRISGLSDQAVPVLRLLHANAPAINSVTEQLGPFSQAARPAVRALGRAAKIGGPALVKTLPRARQIKRLAIALRPVASDAAELLSSLQTTGGIERLMDYIFYQSTSINGEDTFGHYLRAGLLTGGAAPCSFYAIAPPTTPGTPEAPNCSANFNVPSTGAVASSARSQPRDQELLKTARILLDAAARQKAGRPMATPEQAKAIAAGEKVPEPGGAAPATTGAAGSAGGAPSRPSSGSALQLPETLPFAGKTKVPHANRQAPIDPTTGLLDYLIGSGG